MESELSDAEENEQSDNGIGNTKNKYGKRWSKREDSQLMSLVEKYGQSWDKILTFFEYRSIEHVENRWVRLHTEEIRKSEWTPEEDAKLRTLVDKYGKKWTRVSEHMTGRSGVKCRRRYYAKHGSLPVVKTPIAASEKFQKIDTMSKKCYVRPRTPSPFKNALASFGVKSFVKRRAPSIDDAYIGDLAEMINSELNLNNSEKSDKKLSTTEEKLSRPKRACKSLPNFSTNDKKKKKKSASCNDLHFQNEKNDESTKENCPMVRRKFK